MLSKLFRTKASKTGAPVRPVVPEGIVVWAIGDVHGRMDLLLPLVQAIQLDAAVCGAARKIVVFLGDYVDRGAQSREVIQYLSQLESADRVEWRFLKGNHEETMLDFLENPGVGSRWCEYGGEETIRSYGLEVPQLRHRADAWKRLSADLSHKLSITEREFLENLELSITIGDYFFSHAGARPGVPLEEQSPRDLMWIRQDFIDNTVEFKQVVVHGHTPTVEVHSDNRRIGVDTKAYQSGILTAVRFEGGERSCLQTFATDVGAVGVQVRLV